MRVIFRTPPITTKRTDPQTGKVMQVVAEFAATVFDPGDDVPTTPEGEPGAPLMSYWRSVSKRGQPLPIHVYGHYANLPRDLAIPNALLDALPDSARLMLEWRWREVR